MADDFTLTRVIANLILRCRLLCQEFGSLWNNHANEFMLRKDLLMIEQLVSHYTWSSLEGGERCKFCSFLWNRCYYYCLKSARIRVFRWPVFFRIGLESEIPYLHGKIWSAKTRIIAYFRRNMVTKGLAAWIEGYWFRISSLCLTVLVAETKVT